MEDRDHGHGVVILGGGGRKRTRALGPPVKADSQKTPGQRQSGEAFT